MMVAKVYVYLKKSVADPQGLTILHALNSLGFSTVKDVRAGKYFELRFNEGVSADQCSQQVKSMCEKLLTNQVIEDYSFEIGSKAHA